MLLVSQLKIIRCFTRVNNTDKPYLMVIEFHVSKVDALHTQVWSFRYQVTSHREMSVSIL